MNKYSIQKPISIVGSSMIDLIGRSFDSIILKDSNPGTIKISAGGVSRNIAENLARLNVPIHFVTSLGNDHLCKVIIDSIESLGVDMTYSYRSLDQSSPIYLAILDNDGDMSLALSDTATLDVLPIEHLKQVDNWINEGQLLIFDASLISETAEYLVKRFSEKPIYCDPVSIGKSKHIKHLLSYFYMLKCNRLEAQFLCDMEIESDKDYFLAAKKLHQIGIKQVVITRGEKGLFYSIEGEQGFYKHRLVDVENATGAGDAFLAGWIYGELHNFDLSHKLKFASEMSAIALESMSTVNPHLNVSLVEEAIR